MNGMDNNFDNENENNDQDFETMSDIATQSSDGETAGQWEQIKDAAEQEVQPETGTSVPDAEDEGKPPTWLHKGREYPLYPADGVQWATTEVTEPGTGKTIGLINHGFSWTSGSPFFTHQGKLKSRSEQLPGNRVRQSQTDTLSADADLYASILVEGDYYDNATKKTTRLTRDEMLELCDREDRSRAIRAFFNVTVREIVPEYKDGLEMLRNNKSPIKQYEMLFGDPSNPSAAIVFTMHKADTQARINYEASVSDTETLRRGDLSLEETSYNLQTQVNFAKKHFISAEGAAFRQSPVSELLEAAGSRDSADRIKLAADFLDGLCPRWVGTLGDKHYGSASKTQGKS